MKRRRTGCEGRGARIRCLGQIGESRYTGLGLWLEILRGGGVAAFTLPEALTQRDNTATRSSSGHSTYMDTIGK